MLLRKTNGELPAATLRCDYSVDMKRAPHDKYQTAITLTCRIGALSRSLATILILSIFAIVIELIVRPQYARCPFNAPACAGRLHE